MKDAPAGTRSIDIHMAKRSSKAKTATRATTKTGTTGTVEDRVLAFAEQLGWMAGTLEKKAEGWMDRETLHKQISAVRDGASSLLQQLAAGATKGVRGAKKKAAPTPAPKRAAVRSGGAVDAPGKKHRKPAPANLGVGGAKAQAESLRAATPMAKTYQAKAYQHRARG
jgi:hypothetical protein